MDAMALGTVWRLPSGRIARVVGHAWNDLNLILQYEDDGDKVTLRRQFLAACGEAI
ncbi:hypothetical protein [Azohydromonas lata]|uniref:hypothetical protein n=1 Tax=Azohydromonas lata TaxID=45677 RepID=UPI0012F4CAAD|nr:hypothetical protein [Azohydromonas lata]